MVLRRGFVTEANSLARDVRRELGLRPADPLDPWALAQLLEVPVFPLSDFVREAPRAVRRFSVQDRTAFSAMTVFVDGHRAIVHNDAHAPSRQASNVMHESAHGLLLHPRTPPLDAGRLTPTDRGLEEEAGWLAGVLLIPEEAALAIVRDGLSLDEAATLYGCSPRMISFRLNVTAAHRRAGGRRALAGTG